MEKLENVVEGQSHFSKGLSYAKEYYTAKGTWDVSYEVIYNEFRLGVWWTSTKRSIIIGSLSDVQVQTLLDSGIDFGIMPLYYEQWFELVKKWMDNNGVFPVEKCMYEGYGIGKWFKRNKKEFEYRYNKIEKRNNGTEKVHQTVNEESAKADPTMMRNANFDFTWERMYDKFSVAWKGAKEDRLSSENGYTQSVYMWGLRQIEGVEGLELWKRNRLEDIGFVWDIEAYEKIFSPWFLQFNIFRKMYEIDEDTFVEEYTIGSMRRFDWAEEQLISQIEDWKRKKFQDIGIDNVYTLRMVANKKQKLIQDAKYHNKMKELNESRLSGDREGITSVKVIGRTIDYVRSDVTNSVHDCDYYEVQIQVCSTFDELEFREYVNNNRQRFVECGRNAIKEERSKKWIFPFSPKLKVDKMVYGLKSHMVSIMFSVQMK